MAATEALSSVEPETVGELERLLDALQRAVVLVGGHFTDIGELLSSDRKLDRRITIQFAEAGDWIATSSECFRDAHEALRNVYRGYLDLIESDVSIPDSDFFRDA